MPPFRFLSVLVLLALLCPDRIEARDAALPLTEPVLELASVEWLAETSWTEETQEEDGAPVAVAPALAVFGPFRVTGPDSADMIGLVDSDTPDQFAAMLRAFPGIARLRMIECPGSDDDEANLRLARMVRNARIETFVPAGGSVRSGAVELFLAGVHRSADSRAEFAVHSWRDALGREARDVPEDDPVHREYLEFYREMGLSEAEARRFYALTNSVSFDDAVFLEPLQMAALGLLDML
jgi:hypothetical protein